MSRWTHYRCSSGSGWTRTLWATARLRGLHVTRANPPKTCTACAGAGQVTIRGESFPCPNCRAKAI